MANTSPQAAHPATQDATSTHTPGPWAFHPVDLIVFDVTVKLGIARIEKQPGDIAADLETLANGSLIAAAPDLLAACNEAVDLLGEIFDSLAGSLTDDDDTDLTSYRRVLNQLDDAIAKAKGK